MAVKTQEILQTRLELRGQGAAAVVLRQSLRRGLAHGSCESRICARLLGERPERQVHLGRGVVWEAAQHHPPLVVGGEVPQELSGEGVGYEAGDKSRRDAGQDAGRASEQHALDRIEAFGGARALRHLTHRAKFRRNAPRPGPCHLRAHERLDDAGWHAYPDKHR